jgi:alkanesulfonate monooxygenase SsuD/methylene tetrahydromethanopterin reductase-like flavin-dependent oxidoreductase (luciferase family)
VETEVFGIEPGDGKHLTDERIEVMLRAWSWSEADGPLDVSTSADRGTLHARVSPAPFRRGRPLVGRASMTPATIAATAAQGLPVVFGPWDPASGAAHLDLYRDVLLAGGFDDATVDACLAWSVYTVPVVVARTQREADGLVTKYATLAADGPHATPGSTAALWHSEWTRREAGKATFAIAATPQRLVDVIGESVAAGARGVRILPVQVAASPEDHEASLDLILREVMPQLAPEPLPGAIAGALRD